MSTIAASIYPKGTRLRNAKQAHK